MFGSVLGAFGGVWNVSERCEASRSGLERSNVFRALRERIGSVWQARQAGQARHAEQAEQAGQAGQARLDRLSKHNPICLQWYVCSII